MGFFCWVDWLPYLDQTLLNYFNYFIIILFIFILLGNIKNLFPLNNIQKILIFYLIYMILCTLLNEYLFKLNIVINILIIVLILTKKISGTKHLTNGFIFGGFLTGLYMIFMIFDVIKVMDYSAINQFNFGEYFLNSKEMSTSIGFTNKYNKLSYLFSILIYIIFSLNIKSIFKYALIALIVYLQIKTTGRGGFLISILFIGYLSITSKHKYITIPVLLLGFYFLINSFLFHGIGERFKSDNSSSFSRLNQYDYAIENFSDNLFGSGYASIDVLVNAPYIHNFFLNNLLMGGVIGFAIALSFIVILFRRVMNSKMPNDLKVFLFLLFTMQTMFENLNLITALGSFILIWVLIAEYLGNHNIILKNIYNKN